MGHTSARGTRAALGLFAPIAANYERWAALFSLGQDSRWRSEMVSRLDLTPGRRVLDVAAGTGLITRCLQARGYDVVSLDLSAEMLRAARRKGATTVLATAETLPFPDGTFDALTFGYLLRYVSEPLAAMSELARVLRHDGVIGMVEFGRPRGVWGLWWWLYTRLGLPVAGLIAGRGWFRVGAFLGPSIDAFYRGRSDEALIALWNSAGFVKVELVQRSLGGGVLMWARRS